MLRLGLHPRDVDRLTVDEFEYVAATIDATRAATTNRQQADAVATMQALGGSA